VGALASVRNRHSAFKISYRLLPVVSKMIPGPGVDLRLWSRHDGERSTYVLISRPERNNSVTLGSQKRGTRLLARQLLSAMPKLSREFLVTVEFKKQEGQDGIVPQL
jgi:hypothetical protein